MAKQSQDYAECLATCNLSDNTIEVTDPSHIDEVLGDSNPYRVLPNEVVFQALIAHELAHAMLEQSSLGIELAFVDHEYVAAVMELESLEAKWREALIDAAPVSLPAKQQLISALIYGFDPRKFATNAWQHFDSQSDGCVRIQQIMTGDFSFADQLQ